MEFLSGGGVKISWLKSKVCSPRNFVSQQKLGIILENKMSEKCSYKKIINSYLNGNKFYIDSKYSFHKKNIFLKMNRF